MLAPEIGFGLGHGPIYVRRFYDWVPLVAGQLCPLSSTGTITEPGLRARRRQTRAPDGPPRTVMRDDAATHQTHSG